MTGPDALGQRLGEFLLHCQPALDVASRAIVAVEALVRWNHSTRGQLGPGVFVPLVEETGPVVTLGESVLRLSMTVTAEGVETPAQFAFVEVEGCAQGQGCLTGKPQAPLGLAGGP
ncbi:EAL domain-containing protein [Methylobacterium sp. WSM2598]|uniref:EAL domain-containing protein n=1 Tax=Methylobacterium sp. WSM2598 TaxID=398261 RepID=UPI001F2A4A98|nr:EAL domain-containing protein [Methylobacterium sp. WSM2598]